MGIAEASLSGVYVGVGSVGDTVDTGFAYVNMRNTGSGLSPQQTSTQSSEINPQRLAPDSVRTGASGSGDVSIEFSAQSFDRIISAALMREFTAGDGAWQAQTTALPDMSIDVVGVLSTAGADWTDQVATWTEPGSMITLGSAYAANNQGSWLVSEVLTAKSVKLVRADAAWTAEGPITAGATGATLEAQNWVGTDKVPCWVEREFDDGTNIIYTEWYGYGANPSLTVPVYTLVSTFGLTFTPGSISTGSFGFAGAFPNVVDGAPATIQRGGVGAGSESALTTVPFNGMDDVKQIIVSKVGAEHTAYSDALDFAGDASEISFNLNNNIREDQAVGTFGTTNVGLGTPGITGTLNTYLRDKTVLDHMTSFRELFIGMQVEDAAGNRYGFSFPLARIDTGSTPISGNNAAVLANGTINARKMTVSRITV
jgi:hypothetical protein